MIVEDELRYRPQTSVSRTRINVRLWPPAGQAPDFLRSRPGQQDWAPFTRHPEDAPLRTARPPTPAPSGQCLAYKKPVGFDQELTACIKVKRQASGRFARTHAWNTKNSSSLSS